MQRILCWLSLIFLGLPTFAFNIVREKDHIFLQDPSCNESSELLSSLVFWEKTTNPDKKCPLDPTRLPKTGLTNLGATTNTCKYDITNCVPDHVAKYQSTNPKESGPNCWNLSLVMKGILPGLRYSSPEEMHFYMRPPLCRQLKNSEKRQPGDVGAIRELNTRTNQQDEYHGFIYISEKIAYSKNGYSRASPYALQSLENVYRTYEVENKDDCRQNEISSSAICPHAVSYFRCKSMSQYLQETPNVPAEIKTTMTQFNSYEQCLQNKLIQGGVVSPELHKNLTEASQALVSYLQSQRSKNNNSLGMKDEQRDFLIGSLQMRLLAIEHQLDMSFDETSFKQSQDLVQMSKQFQKAADELKTNPGNQQE